MSAEHIASCAFCNKELIESRRSKEHIIPNAIGGRLKTSDFICIECNSGGGDAWDSRLAEQLNWFTLSLGISRERGTPPSQLFNTVDGRQLNLLPDGSFSPKSSYSEEVIEGGKRINIVARSMSEAKKRLAGVAKKHPSLNLESELAKLKIKTTYLDSPLTVELSLGGNESGRSLVKTAVAFASYCGVSHEQLVQAIAYLLDSQSEPPYGHAFLSDLVVNRNSQQLFHCVALKADPLKKRLWSYIEYYSLFRIVVLVSDNYSGPAMDEVYAFNPITGEEVDVIISNEISDEEFIAIISGHGFSSDLQIAAANSVLPIVIARSEQRTLEKSVTEGFMYAAQTLGIEEGEEIPSEKAHEFTSLMMEKIWPYLSNRIKK